MELNKMGQTKGAPKNIFKRKKKEKLWTNKLDHFYCKNISDLFVKLDSYSSARAIDMRDNSSKMKLILEIYLEYFQDFGKVSILRKGYKEKKYGFLIALVASLYPLVSYIKFKFNNNA